MLSIAYVSTSTEVLDDAALTGILTVARANNTARGITGLLAYRDGRFLQLLEGPDDAVESTFAHIAEDVRHADVLVVARDRTDERWFPDWSMAFEPLSGDAVLDVPGFRDFFAERGGSPRSSHTQALLHWFRRHALSSASASSGD